MPQFCRVLLLWESFRSFLQDSHSYNMELVVNRLRALFPALQEGSVCVAETQSVIQQST